MLRVLHEFDDGFLVKEEHGRLTCGCPEYRRSSLMCQHVSTVYHRGWDGRSAKGRRLEWDETVEVIMFVDPPLVVTVTIGPSDLAGDRPAWLADTELLGHVRDGEGRVTLRAMVVDLLTARFTHVDMCPAPHHYRPRYRSHVQEARLADPKAPANLAETYSILAKGGCTRCADGDLDDLVPDVGATAPPWRS